MNKRRFIIICPLLLLFFSCSEIDKGDYYGQGLVIDAEQIGSIKSFVGDFYDLDCFKGENRHINENRSYIDLSNFVIFSVVKGSGIDNSELYSARGVKEYNNVCKRILEECSWTEAHKIYPERTAIITSSINGSISITANKKLFGLEAGANLKDFFNVFSLNNCVAPCDIPFTDFIYTTSRGIPSKIDEYFVKGSCLAADYVFYPINKPSENYSEITFQLSIPVMDFHYLQYYKDLEKKQKVNLNITDRILSSEVTVSCGEVSEFSTILPYSITGILRYLGKN